jgi:hypothetical protein
MEWCVTVHLRSIVDVRAMMDQRANDVRVPTRGSQMEWSVQEGRFRMNIRAAIKQCSNCVRSPEGARDVEGSGALHAADTIERQRNREKQRENAPHTTREQRSLRYGDSHIRAAVDQCAHHFRACKRT